ncbi:centromere protein C-like isoform X3 [Montipora foliosa]|uniref:centromere protein C-like isoform X3 n=1 Tax=Montipora foliosa TaxID=591990 RepID=UPI0035F17610
MAAVKTSRKNAKVHMNDFCMYLPNDPFQDPCIGRRTGIPLNIKARKDSNGFENIDDYFPDSDPEEENIVPNEQIAEQDVFVGRTGMPFNINPRKDSHGFEIVDDYFPDSVSAKSKGSSPESSQTNKPIVQMEKEEDFPQTTSDAVDESTVPETPGATIVSPNETGTLIKNPASCDPTPQFKGTKKRLSFAHGKTPLVVVEHSKPTQSKNPIKNKDGQSDSDIDVVDVDNDVGADCRETTEALSPTTLQATSKAAKHNLTKKSRSTVSGDDDDEVIDVEGIEDDNTFLTIGNATRNEGKAPTDKFPVFAENESFAIDETVVLKGTKHKTMSPEYGSSSDSQTDAKRSPVPKQNKSKIPVRTRKSLPIGTKQKGKKDKENGPYSAAGKEKRNEGKSQGQSYANSSKRRLQGESLIRGRQRKLVERNNEGPQLKEDVRNLSDEEEGDVDVVGEEDKTTKGKMENTRRKSTRGFRKADSDAAERPKSVAGAKQQLKKSTRKAKKNDRKEDVVPESGEEVLVEGEKKGNVESCQGEKRTKKVKNLPNRRQQEEEGRKTGTQGNKENLELDIGDDDDDGTSKTQEETQEKETLKKHSRKTQEKGQKKETVQEKKQEYEDKQESEGSDGYNEDEVHAEEKRSEDRASKETEEVKKTEKRRKHENEENLEGKVDAELSGRKTRAQRKKEANAKLEENGISKETEGIFNGGVKEVEPSDAKTRSQKKKTDVQINKTKAVSGKDRGNDNRLVVLTEAEEAKEGELHDVELGESKKEHLCKKTGTNTSGFKRTNQLERQDREASLETRKEKTDEKEVTTEEIAAEEADNVPLDTIDEQHQEQTLSDKTVQESVSNISNVSSTNASSGSESRKKNGTKRRKKSRILPPYTRKTTKSRKTKTSLKSQDGATESEVRIDAKKPRYEEEQKQSNTAGDSSKEEMVSSRITGRAVSTGSKNAVRKRPVAERSQISDNSVFESQTNDADKIDDGNKTSSSVREVSAVEDRTVEEIRQENLTTKPLSVPSGPSGGVIKSILKSGGSTGRGKTASRKRQMNSDKSHSGGSDADDEGLQPPKQPNRKRLSTVSFATAPFVHSSPLDVPTPSPLAGSLLLSRDSSHFSTDKSFTPGTSTPGRSSGSGSGSGISSAGESDIDPEEEVTLTNGDKLAEGPSNEEGQRRSKRTIVPPLQYWKNERIDYERRKSGGFCIKGVIRNPTPTPKVRKKSKAKRPFTRKEKDTDEVDSSVEEVDNQELEGFEEITNPKGTVFNPEANEEVEMDLFHTPGMLNFTNPAGKLATDDDPLLVHKFISQPLFGGGQVILRPGAEKGRQFVRNDTMVFYVIKGKIVVTIHQSSVVLSTGSTFFVPQGNSYKIKNLKQTDAKLMFVQIKG